MSAENWSKSTYFSCDEKYSISHILRVLRNRGIPHKVQYGTSRFTPSCIESVINGFADISKDDVENVLKFADEPILLDTKGCVIITDRQFYGDGADNIAILVDNPKEVFIILVNELFGESLEDKQYITFDTDIAQPRNYNRYGHMKTHPGPGTIVHWKTYVLEDTIIEANSVIGATGQSFINFQGKRYFMPQIGGVYIGAECFIGSNVTIVRGSLSDTIIGDGVVISHGSAIGHNVEIGANTFIANNVTIAGGAKIGANCFIGSGAVIRNKVVIANNTKVGCGAVVIDDVVLYDAVPNGVVVAGNPARYIRDRKPGEI